MLQFKITALPAAIPIVLNRKAILLDHFEEKLENKKGGKHQSIPHA